MSLEDKVRDLELKIESQRFKRELVEAFLALYRDPSMVTIRERFLTLTGRLEASILSNVRAGELDPFKHGVSVGRLREIKTFLMSEEDLKRDYADKTKEIEATERRLESMRQRA